MLCGFVMLISNRKTNRPIHLYGMISVRYLSQNKPEGAGKKMFSLDERLALCASFVRNGTALADVGTDHAYLPVYLALQRKIRSAVACDVRTGPLENARGNIARFGVEAIVSTRLSDGLQEVAPEEAEDIVMAGMGGELIVRLIEETPWLTDPDRRLILQPMTKPDVLRQYLCAHGFCLLQEKACLSMGKAYSVMVCAYDGRIRPCSITFARTGFLLQDSSPEAEAYLRLVLSKLQKERKGLPLDSPAASQHMALIETISNRLTPDPKEETT